METKQGTIKSIEVSKGASDKGEWTKYLFKMTDGKNYSTFDSVIGKAFESGDTVEFTGEQSGKYWNLKSMHKIDAINIRQTIKPMDIIAPQDFGKQDDTSFYTSYAKDIFISLLEKTNMNLDDEETIMRDAIDLVKQAREAFS